jgi:hypothetical protein
LKSATQLHAQDLISLRDSQYTARFLVLLGGLWSRLWFWSWFLFVHSPVSVVVGAWYGSDVSWTLDCHFPVQHSSSLERKLRCDFYSILSSNPPSLQQVPRCYTNGLSYLDTWVQDLFQFPLPRALRSIHHRSKWSYIEMTSMTMMCTRLGLELWQRGWRFSRQAVLMRSSRSVQTIWLMLEVLDKGMECGTVYPTWSRL